MQSAPMVTPSLKANSQQNDPKITQKWRNRYRKKRRNRRRFGTFSGNNLRISRFILPIYQYPVFADQKFPNRNLHIEQHKTGHALYAYRQISSKFPSNYGTIVVRKKARERLRLSEFHSREHKFKILRNFLIHTRTFVSVLLLNRFIIHIVIPIFSLQSCISFGTIVWKKTIAVSSSL